MISPESASDRAPPNPMVAINVGKLTAGETPIR